MAASRSSQARRGEGNSAFSPIVARSRTVCRPIRPVAYDCVTLTFVRCGSAILLSEFGERPVAVGDVVLLGANTLCGSEPEGSVTVTTLYLDRDYVVDQVFWQHAATLTDRFEARDLVEQTYAEPAQVLRLGDRRAGLLTPWLDELVALSIEGPDVDRYYRLQALLFAVLDVVLPLVKTTRTRRSPTQRRAVTPGAPRHRQFSPLRTEARQVAELLHDAPERRWTLRHLAERTYLSPAQLSRVFIDAYGKTPLAYLTMIRAEHLARLLRETDLSIEAAAQRVGWRSRNHASRVFSQCVGVTPGRYRQLNRETRDAIA